MAKTPATQKSSKAKPAAKSSGSESEGTLTRQAYVRLQEMLITLELKPGMMISESEMAESLSLGRTPIREAVQQLQREGLLEVHRARGIMVSPVNVVRQLQLLDVRRGLEQLVAKRASRQASEAQRTAMIQLAAQVLENANNNDPMGFIRTNREIHSLKVQATGNEILNSVMGLFYGLSMRFWYASYSRQPHSLVEAGKLHADILRAICTADENKAAELTDQLMDFLETFTRKSIELN
jgi:DNA-binding GntR family transcriptional regulator